MTTLGSLWFRANVWRPTFLLSLIFFLDYYAVSLLNLGWVCRSHPIPLLPPCFSHVCSKGAVWCVSVGISCFRVLRQLVWSKATETWGQWNIVMCWSGVRVSSHSGQESNLPWHPNLVASLALCPCNSDDAPDALVVSKVTRPDIQHPFMYC